MASGFAAAMKWQQNRTEKMLWHTAFAA